MSPPSSTPSAPAPTGPLDEARSLADQGRYAAAIDLLERVNRASPDPEVQAELVTLRRRGFDALRREGGRQDWPPSLTDPFPDLRGRLPEVGPDRLTSELVGGAILHHGALIVRGVLDPVAVAHTIATIDEAFDGYERYAAGEVDPARRFVPFDDSDGLRQRRDWVRRAGAVWAADCPAALSEVIGLLRQRNMPALVRGYFGEQAVLSVNKLTLRRVDPGGTVTWHQDGAFLGEGTRAINLWITLSACGGDNDETPGLGVVPRRIDEILDCETAWMGNAVNVDLVNERFGPEITVPELAAGDGILFDERFLHVTHRSPSMTRERYTIETWYFSASHFPPDYAGLLP